VGGGEALDAVVLALAVLAVATSFTVSASAGFGGSLVLVPALALVLGTREGIALAALLLAGNNVVKVLAYRSWLPWRASAGVLAVVLAGSVVGAVLLVAAPEDLVTVAVIASFVAAFLVERFDLVRLRRAGAPVLAAAAGLTSGFSGTSGPLKGLAVRGMGLDRMHLVGCLSLLSLAGDAGKTAVFAQAGLLSAEGWSLAVVSLPLMAAATWTGRRINSSVGELGYTALFWTVMAGYTVRLLAGV
jgi:uncharacterized protein